MKVKRKEARIRGFALGIVGWSRRWTCVTQRRVTGYSSVERQWNHFSTFRSFFILHLAEQTASYAG